VTEAEHRGGLRGMLRRLATDSQEREAEELAEEAAASGATPMSGCGERRKVTVYGRVRSTMLRPRAGSQSLEADVWDGSGTVSLVWLGRKEVAGVAPGAHLRATGRICLVDERPTIYNPRYELLPDA
jgi:RecG-like helicase